MGTTLCAVGITENGQLGVINVGDSRAYLYRNGTLSQLTNDHSVTADLVRRGELSPDEAIEHPHRHVLTRVLGAAPAVDIDAALHPVQPGDRVLLCTDGLFREIDDRDLTSRMDATSDAAAAVDALVDAALARGGTDNITVAIADIVG